MNETQKRIAEYKKILPKLKEKVAAVALLLVVAIAMSTTVTFAWLVLARAPELSGVSTSLAANGNLEIALVGPEGYRPNATEAGDAGKDLLYKNITWGNLVNLMDASYGLENLTLRPALLNENSLLSSPLYNAVYGEDGRIVTLDSDFGYTTWNSSESKFLLSTNYGVRAISSIKKDISADNQKYYDDLKLAKAANANARVRYEGLGDVTYNNTPYSEIIAGLMSVYLKAKINDGDADVSLSDLKAMQAMYAELINVYMLEVQAVANLLNVQKSALEYSDGNKLEPVDGYTAQDVLNMTSSTVAELKAKGYKFSTTNDGIMAKITQFVKDYNTLITDKSKLDDLVERGTTAKWDGDEINVLVNNLVNIGTCDLIWEEGGMTKTQSVGGIGMSNATSLLGAMKKENKPRVLVKGGILKNIDEYAGAHIQMVVTVPVILGMKIEEATVYTNANISRFDKDADAVSQLINDVFNAEGNMISTAQDTYALAIDLWVRTNASGSYLTLEGNVLTETVNEEVFGQDIDGNEVRIYTISRKTGEMVEVGGIEMEETVSYDLYPCQVPDPDGGEGATKDGWRLASIHSVFELEEGENPNPKINVYDKIIGYEGENRVWGDNSKLSVDSTTQGSGSCYVFYVNAEDQERTIEMLKAFKVAFIDGETGELLSTAYLDTESAYVSTSKAIVPLRLNPLDSDFVGDGMYAITALERNIPRRITMLIYLDGSMIENDNVLSSSEIQGNFNVQFGSSVELKPTEDEKLMSETMAVTGAFTDSLGNMFAYSENAAAMTKKLQLTFEGSKEFDSNDRVQAFFIRKINDAQGSRGETFDLHLENGNWVGEYRFTAPGTYVLRSVLVNGVEYTLKNELDEIEITGLEVTQASYDFKSYILTASSTYTGTATITVSTPANLEPSTIRGVFERKGASPASIVFKKEQGSVWTGRVTFTESGEYKLTYLVVDGNLYSLPESMHKTVKVTLGMSVVVTTTSKTNFLLDPMSTDPDMTSLKMEVKIYDNNGKALEMLSDVQLNYPMTTSSSAKMNTNLTWNSDKKAYVGEFETKAGNFTFGDVTVGENIITRANADAPTFRIIPPYEPKFLQIGDNGAYAAYQYGKGEITVTFAEAPAAEAVALFVNQATNEELEVQGTGAGDETAKMFTFAIPESDSGEYDGTWVLKSVGLSGVYVDGTYYDGEGEGSLYEAPKLVQTLNYSAADNTSNVTFSLLTKVNVKFVDVFATANPLGFSATDTSGSMQVGWFGKNNSSVTGTFLQTHTVAAGKLQVVFTDGAGNVIDPNFVISDVKLMYKYVTNTKYGGYTTGTLANGVVAGSYTFDATGDGKTYQTNGAMSFQYAARYEPTLSYKITVPGAEGKEIVISTFAVDQNAPVVEVWSKAPSVTISAITPTGNNPAEITYTTESISTCEGGGTRPTFTATGNKESKSTVYEATLYAVATVDNSTQRHGSFTQPTLTVTIAGVGTNDTVSFILPAGSASAITFSRTGNGTIKQTLGTVSQISSWTSHVALTHTLDAYYGHGDQTIETITVTRNGIAYTITLENSITIHNYSSTNH